MNPRDFPLPKAGQVWPNFLAESFIRPFVQRVNALSNVTIVRGNADTAVLSDGNLVLTIKDDEVGAAGGGSSVAVYKITGISNIGSDYIAAKKVTFDNANAETLGGEVNVALPWQLRASRPGKVAPSYAVNDYIVVASSETGVGIAVSSIQLTLIDIGIGRMKVSDVRRFTINASQSNNDYLVCDEAPSGLTNINVYKPYKLRGSITAETIAGDSVTYGTYGSDKMSRTATIGSNSEKQVIIPYFLTGDSIFAFYDSVAGQWQDLNVDGRAWARKWDQS